MKRLFLLLALPGLLFSPLWAQKSSPTLGLHDNSPSLHAFTHCTLVTAPGKTTTDGLLIIDKGVVTYAGVATGTIPKGAAVHDLEGLWIYPGLIDIYSDYGVPELKKGGGGRDAPPQYETQSPGPVSWNQALKPGFEVATGFTPDPEKAAELRKLGFVTVNAVPNDGIFRGSSVLVNLGEGKAGEEIVRGKAAACFSFQKGSSTQNYPSSLMGAIALIRQTLYDADWYQKARAAYQKNPQQTPPEYNQSLEAVNRIPASGLPQLFEVRNWQDLLRAQKIAEEFGLSYIFKGSGDEYKRLEIIKNIGAPLILPLNFPNAYDVTDPNDALALELEKMRHWEMAPANPVRVNDAGIPYAFTLNGLKKPSKMKNALSKVMGQGLSPEDALAAWTTQPAKLLGLEASHGALEKGKAANFLITSGPLFEKETDIYETWISGDRYPNAEIPAFELRGTWKITSGQIGFDWIVTGSPSEPKGKVMMGEDTLKTKISRDGLNLLVSFAVKDHGAYRMTGMFREGTLKGMVIMPNGAQMACTGERTAQYTPEAKKEEKQAPSLVSSLVYPNLGFGRSAKPEQGTYLIRNATVWTNTDQGKMEAADVLVQNGKIQKVGTNLEAGSATIINGTGLHLTPGIIDEHSHIAIQNGVNEGTHAVTAEVRIGDVIDCEDVNIYRQLAGGVTTSQLLHGSANPIGGQSAIIKLRWGALPEEMKFAAAPGFIKFALGENVKQSNWGDDYKTRYPQTRVGVEQTIKDAFQAAKDYRQAWKNYDPGSGLAPPRKNLQLETLLEILDGKRFITCHSYVQSELNMLMKTGDEVGFKVNTFTHVLEGYKVATQMKAHGANGSTFSDWWAYKYEVQDAIPYNAAIMAEQGINVCINSDDREMGRRLNQEAAKAIKYGGTSEEEALKMVTLNPAKALHIDHRVGSIEAGKDADLVLWSDHPLSVYAVPQNTLIDGRIYFDREQDAEMREGIAAERNLLVQKLLKEEGDDKEEAASTHKEEYHCETLQSDYNE